MNIDTTTDEGKFVENMFEKVTSVTKDIDMSNPMAAVAAMMTNGALTDLFSLGSSEEGKGPDPKKLMKMFKKVLNNMIPDE
jgi:ribosomal protein L17